MSVRDSLARLLQAVARSWRTKTTPDCLPLVRNSVIAGVFNRIRRLARLHPDLSSGVLGAVLLTVAIPTSDAFAQASRPIRRHQAISQQTAPGQAGRWANRVNPKAAHQPQTVRIELPDGAGSATFFQPGTNEETELPYNHLAVLRVGALYRFKIADLPDYPGVELYPTIELLDKLHPPAGKETAFSIPVAFTPQEIEQAAQGRLVTKVIYLERPELAQAKRATNVDRAYLGEPGDNPIEMAHREGRPMAVVRMGGRTPDLTRPEPGFFGDGAPVEIVAETLSSAPRADNREVSR